MSASSQPTGAGAIERTLDTLIADWVGQKVGLAAPRGAQVPFAELGLGPRDILDLVVHLEDHLGAVLENPDLNARTLASPASLRELMRQKVAAKPPRKRRRLVHVTSEFLPHLSGPQRLISDLHEQLAEWLDFQVYTFDLDRGLASRERLGEIPVARFLPPRATDLQRLRTRFQRIAVHPGLDPEEICNYDLPSTDVFAALQRTRADGIVSYFYSGILAQELVDFFPSREWVLIPSYFEAPAPQEPSPSWWDVRRVDKLLLFQEQDYRAAREYGVAAEKVTLLPFPVNTERFRPLDRERNPETLLYVGRLTANKGIRAFLETFRWMLSKRPSLRLRLVADLTSPSPAERQELERLRAAVAKLDLGAQVEFAGRKEGQDLVEEYARHQVHILPSIGDCYSLATMEALACGLSCVNLDNPHYEWQRQRDGEQPLVHLSPTLPEMGRTILALLEAGEFPSHRDYVVRHLSWSAHRDQYREFFLA